jgi:non-specific serine/threonine protein kinase
LHLADALARTGEHARAAGLHAESLTLFHPLAEEQGAAAALYGLASGAGARGDHRRAALLFAAADLLAEAAGAPGGAFLRPAVRREHARGLAAARAALGEAAFAAAWAQGRATALEQVVGLARAAVGPAGPAEAAGGRRLTDPAPARPPAAALPDGLTAREGEVLRGVAAGKRNREIAADLVLSVRTVEKHIAHLYAKIGVRGRAAAATYAVRHALLDPEAPPG